MDDRAVGIHVFAALLCRDSLFVSACLCLCLEHAALWVVLSSLGVFSHPELFLSGKLMTENLAALMARLRVRMEQVGEIERKIDVAEKQKVALSARHARLQYEVTEARVENACLQGKRQRMRNPGGSLN